MKSHLDLNSIESWALGAQTSFGSASAQSFLSPLLHDGQIDPRYVNLPHQMASGLLHAQKMACSFQAGSQLHLHCEPSHLIEVQFHHTSQILL